MPLTSKDIVPISQARSHLTELAEEVVRNRSPKMLTRNGESLVAIISAEDFDELQRWRQADHITQLKEIALALQEVNSGGGTDLDTLRAELQDLQDWIESPEDVPVPSPRSAQKSAAKSRGKGIAKKAVRAR